MSIKLTGAVGLEINAVEILIATNGDHERVTEWLPLVLSVGDGGIELVADGWDVLNDGANVKINVRCDGRALMLQVNGDTVYSFALREFGELDEDGTPF